MSGRVLSIAPAARARPRGSVAFLSLLLAAVLWMALGASAADTAKASRAARAASVVAQEPEQKLTAAAGEESSGAQAGFDVALSGDGDTALVGAPGDAGYIGAASVFSRTASGWTQQGAKLTAGEVGGAKACKEEHELSEKEEKEEEEEKEEGSSGAEEQQTACAFGRAVALSSDGNTALVGAPRENGQQGAAWVFTRSEAGAWSPPLELTGVGETPKGRFGRAVALSGDGQTAVIGAPADGDGSGRVWVFTRTGSGWSQQGGSLVGAGESGPGHFGESVAVSGDGGTVLAGAPGDSGHLGAAWAFVRSGEGWSQQGSKLTGAEASAEAHFGTSVALSGDAGTALVGGRGQSEDAGAAWAFASTGSGWSEQHPMLTAGVEPGEELGYSVALSEDGSSALVGAPHARGARGSAWLFERATTNWSSPPERLEGGPQESEKGWFGSSVSLSSDASRALVGARADNAKTGAAFVFGPAPSISGVSPAEGPAAGSTTVTISGANLGEATAVRFGANPAASFTIVSPTSVTAVSPAGLGTVDVTVQNLDGTSAVSSLDHFKYVGELSGGGGAPGGGTISGTSSTTTSTPSSTTGTLTPPTGTAGVLGFGPSSGGGCAVTLLAKKLTVRPHFRAAVKLHGSGVSRCAGKLRLRVRLHGSYHRSTLKTIGTAVFAVTGARTVTVMIKLNATGRTLLASGRGRLNASLLVVRSSPAPYLSRTASVRLARVAPSRTASAKR